LIGLISIALPLLVASAASAISFTLAGANGQAVTVGDQVTVTVTLDTEATLGITLLSIGVLFDDTRLAYNKAASSATSYMFYGIGTKGSPNNFLTASATCGGFPSPNGYYSSSGSCEIRVGTTNQVNLDFVSNDLAVGTSSANTGVALLATLVFDVLDNAGSAAIGLSQTSPGNIIGQPGGGSTTATLLGSGSVCINPIPGPDSDGDGIGDNCDNCPAISNAGQEDFDVDGVGNVCDPDRDGDLVPNEQDVFPDDPSEASDIDGDGVGDNGDNCPGSFNPGQEDLDGDGEGDVCDLDTDNDGVPDESDNCPFIANLGQENADGDAFGDVCDADLDGDGTPNIDDNCPLAANADQADGDGDGLGDVCDNCALDFNPGQEDSTGNGVGDVCNDEDLDGLIDALETDTGIFVSADDTGSDPLVADTDGDGLGDGKEVLDYGSDPNDTDTDGDTHLDGADNCVVIANTDQANEEVGDEDTSLPGTQQYGNLCDADLDSSGFVNTADFFGYFRGCFAAVVTGPDCAPSDFDGSGVVNTTDFFAYFLPAFGKAPGPGIDSEAAAWTSEGAAEARVLGDPLSSGLPLADLAFLQVFDTDLDGVFDHTDNCSLAPNPSQLDADADGFGNACDADLNNDGAVGFDDVTLILARLGTPHPAADLNGDGAVGLDDVSAALGQVGTAPGPGAAPCGDGGPCL